MEGYHVHVKVVEVPSGKVRKEWTLPKGHGMQGVVAANGKTLIVSSPYEVAVLYDLGTGKELDKLTSTERMPGSPKGFRKLGYADLKARQANQTTRLAISSDGKWLGVGTVGGYVSVWDLARKKRLWRKQPYDREVDSLGFSPDGERVFALARFTLNLWKRSGGVPWMEKNVGFRHATFMPDGETLLLSDLKSRLGFVRWDPAEDRFFGADWRLQRGEKGLGGLSGMALSKNGETLALRRGTRRLEIWDLRKFWPKK